MPIPSDCPECGDKRVKTHKKTSGNDNHQAWVSKIVCLGCDHEENDTEFDFSTYITGAEA